MVLYQIKSTNPYIWQRVVKSVGGSGFLGRVAIMEMCTINQLISEKKSPGSSMSEIRTEAAKKRSFLSLSGGNETGCIREYDYGRNIKLLSF